MENFPVNSVDIDIYNGSNEVLGSDSLLAVVDPLTGSDILLPGTKSMSKTSNADPFASLGNVVIGNGKFIIGSENIPESFTSMVTTTVDGLLYSIFDRLRNRLPLNDAGSDSSSGNPFADGRNPYGEGNMPLLPGLNDSTSVDSENFPVEVVNQVDGGENPFAGGGGNPFASGDGMPQQSSFDISTFVLAQSLDFLNGVDDGSMPQLSTIDILSSVQANLLGFTNSIDEMFASGNTTPLQTPSSLLNLFRAGMFSFNSGIDAVNQVAAGDSSGGSSNPFASLFAGGNNPFANLSAGGEIPFDILNVVLEGILPFNGSDNVFTTSDGNLPIGNGNRDFGTGNVAIGNANWDYGNYNAAIGNGNWHWDSSSDNATIGNGNWHWNSTSDNRTVGNGNWYWDSTRDNTTLGNGNWHFGNNNTTLGSGNWDFGSNNTVIGNGNWVFTSNSIVIGNGNWSVIIDKSTAGASDFLSNLDTLTLGMGVKDAVDNLANSFIGKMGEAFLPLTGDLGDLARQTYDRLILSEASNAGTFAS